MEKQQFINLVKNGAVEGMSQYGINASLTIAQAICESSWGESGLTKQANNLFGIKADGSWNGARIAMPTEEVFNGVRQTVNADFRKYNSLSDSILDHTKFLVENSRYANLRGVKDYKTACALIREDGYATDPNYTNTLIEIIQENNLSQYDNGTLETASTQTATSAVTASDTVKIIQQQLNTLLKKGLVVDGIEGQGTNAAIKEFQSAMGLSQDGIWGTKTAGAVGQIYNRPSDGVTYAHMEYATRYIQFRCGGSIDGTFGNQTKINVQNWQAKHGLSADGVVGAATWGKLLDENV